jgi:hypothetical protein
MLSTPDNYLLSELPVASRESLSLPPGIASSCCPCKDSSLTTGNWAEFDLLRNEMEGSKRLTFCKMSS